MCPIPPAHTYATARAAYKAAQHKFPSLTPAAWRKAAAQDMGLDYGTYLKLWKTKPKTPMIPESSPTLPASSAVGPDMGLVKATPKQEVDYPDYFKGNTDLSLNQKASDELVPAGAGDYIDDLAFKKTSMSHSDELYAGQDVALNQSLIDKYVKDGFKFNPDDPIVLIRTIDGKYIVADGHHRVIAARIRGEGFTALVKKVDFKISTDDFVLSHVDEVKAAVSKPSKWEPTAGDSYSKQAQEVKSAWTGTKITYDEAVKWLDLLDDSTSFALEAKFIKELKSSIVKAFNESKAASAKVWAPKFGPSYDRLVEVQNALTSGVITKQEALKWLETMKPGTDGVSYFAQGAVQTFKSEILATTKAVADDIIQTHLGPLSHNLAKSAYKYVKNSMPGASPAVLRKAAAEYLKVSYKDYLKAWKKPTSIADNAKTVPIGKFPPVETTLSNSTYGKYALDDVSPDTIKNELAKLFGPKANKAYITMDPTPAGIMPGWITTFPKSLVTNQAAEKAILKALDDLGFVVTKYTSKAGMSYKITNPGISKNLTKITQVKAKAQTAGKPIPAGDPVFMSPSGNALWDRSHADVWAGDWWKGLSASQRSAVRKYTGNGYHEMNSGLRGRSAITSADATSNAHLTAAMRPLPHEVTVFRGSSVPIGEFKSGMLWEDKGFHSTTIQEGGGFSGQTKFKIVLPKGTKGAYVDPHSSHTGEREVILDQGTKFRVISVVGNLVHLMAIVH